MKHKRPIFELHNSGCSVNIKTTKEKNNPRLFQFVTLFIEATQSPEQIVEFSLKMDLQKHNFINCFDFQKVHSKIWACACVASSHWVQILYEVAINF